MAKAADTTKDPDLALVKAARDYLALEAKFSYWMNMQFAAEAARDKKAENKYFELQRNSVDELKAALWRCLGIKAQTPRGAFIKAEVAEKQIETYVDSTPTSDADFALRSMVADLRTMARLAQ